MKHRIAVILLLSMLLTACGKRELPPPEEPAPAPVGILGQASGLEEDAPLLTIGGQEIPGWEYLYWLARDCRELEEQYRSAGLTADWEQQTDGVSLAQQAKEQALADCALYAAVRTLADEAEIPPQDPEALARRWAERVNDYGSEDIYLAHLSRWGLTRERAEALASVGIRYARLREQFLSGGGPLASAAEHPVTAEVLRFPTQEAAAQAFSALNSAADQAAQWAALLAEQQVEAGELAETDPLRAAAQALEAGQYSGILEDSSGFALLRRTAPTAQQLESLFDRLLEQRAAAAEIDLTAQLAELDAAAFYRALTL